MVVIGIHPSNNFYAEIKKAQRDLDDLTVPFKLMTREWYKGNRSIFDLNRKGPGKYADLSPKYKTKKTEAIGSPYPILVGYVKPLGLPARRSGKLAASMIDPANKDTIATIVNKKTLLLGTKVTGEGNVPYPFYLNEGTSKMPARRFLLIGGEQVATKEINKRRDNWIKLLRDYAMQKSPGKVK